MTEHIELFSEQPPTETTAEAPSRRPPQRTSLYWALTHAMAVYGVEAHHTTIRAIAGRVARELAKP